MMVTKLASSFKNTVFRAMPGEPEEGTWTNIGPSLDWWMAFMMLGAAKFVGAMGLVVRAEQVVSTSDGGALVTEELNFKAAQGARQVAFVRVTQVNVVDIIIVQIVLEAQRYMVAYCRGASAKPKPDSVTCCNLRICDLTNQNHSPARLMKQSVTKLLLDDSPSRLMLLFGMVGDEVNRLSELWCVRRPLAERYQRTVKAMAVAFKMRYDMFETDPKYTVCSLVDPRICMPVKERTAYGLWTNRRECCSRIMCALLHTWHEPDSALGPAQQSIIKGHALAMEEGLTVAGIERRHNMSNVILKSGCCGTGWDTSCSASVIKETASTHDVAVATEQLVK